MKNTFLFILAVGFISLWASCQDPKPADKTDEVATEQPTADRPARNNTKGTDPAERFVALFEQMGMELTPEQKQQITTIAAKYDIGGAQDREARRELMTQFQNEISNTVLTPDQQAVYANHQAENQKKREERQK